LVLSCDSKAIEYLKAKDRTLGAAIDRIGVVERPVDPDLFSAVTHQIVGQQISTVAQATIWRRMTDAFGAVTPGAVAAAGVPALQRFGISFRKAGYIWDFARAVESGDFDLDALWALPDEEVIRRLSALRGVGVWTAEMLLTFCMGRPDVVSFGDLAILRGMRMLYRHRTIDRVKFDRYRRRYSPYGTTASLYLWAVAGGALPELTDPAAPRRASCKGGKKP